MRVCDILIFEERKIKGRGEMCALFNSLLSQRKKLRGLATWVFPLSSMHTSSLAH